MTTCRHNFKGAAGSLCPLCPTDQAVAPLTDDQIADAIGESLERSRRCAPLVVGPFAFRHLGTDQVTIDRDGKTLTTVAGTTGAAMTALIDALRAERADR